MNPKSGSGTAETGVDFRDVGCAVIYHHGRLLVAQRGYGSNLGGYWEFPGGKREPEETIEACLVREVWEELRVRIRPERYLTTHFHVDPFRRLALHFYLCAWEQGSPVAYECLAFRWIEPEEMRRLMFPPADRDIIETLIRKKLYYFGRLEKTGASRQDGS